LEWIASLVPLGVVFAVYNVKEVALGETDVLRIGSGKVV
jgi:hypothetical protein